MGSTLGFTRATRSWALAVPGPNKATPSTVAARTRGRDWARSVASRFTQTSYHVTLGSSAARRGPRADGIPADQQHRPPAVRSTVARQVARATEARSLHHRGSARHAGRRVRLFSDRRGEARARVPVRRLLATDRRDARGVDGLARHS